MQELENISIEDYNYTLQNEKIAKYPLHQRDLSKLLVYREKRITQNIFTHLCDYISNKNILVFNNTKVIRARILFTKETGANIEIFCLEPFSPGEFTLAFQSKETCSWKCIIGNAKKWKSQTLTKIVKINNNTFSLIARKIEKDQSEQIVEFSWDNNYSFSEVLEATGIIPIPPYLNRKSEESDTTNYQTIYSKIKGSVAAPTAGLHFTDSLLNRLTNNGIKCLELTLHVGAGTFKPVQTNKITSHEMHTEHFSVSKNFIEELIQKKGHIIAVGTTSVRTLESLYWLGVKIFQQKIKAIPEISQWDGFSLDSQLTSQESLESILEYMDFNNIETLNTATRILIAPGYKFKIINGLITNFHLPKSTLLLLIAALIGDNWKKVYQYALDNDFRFLSYGDSSLLFPSN